MSDPIRSNITLSGFHFDQVNPTPPALDSLRLHFQQILQVNPGLASILKTHALAEDAVSLSSPLGDLTGFTNPCDPTDGIVFAGNGFNTIFRPQSTATPTKLPFPAGGDNVLELNLTAETMSFSAPLGNVPNRGTDDQPDIFLNGVPYVQAVNDITSGTAVGIHFEPGMWLAVPPTVVPDEAATTYSRMASIPHGVTINAQGISLGRKPGAPLIGPVNINPFFIGGSQQPSASGTRFFPSQDVTQQKTARIPQDLTPFTATITQAMLDDPNIVLRNHLIGLNVDSFVTLIVTTDPSGKRPTPPPNPSVPPTPPLPPVVTAPGIGGGTGQIGFLAGDGNTPPTNPNADAFKMTAIFWIEKIKVKLVVPPCKANGLPILIQPPASPHRPFRPTFSVTPPGDIHADKTIEVTYTQIQYSQTVFLNFRPLTWPHVSVATLIPAGPIAVPNSAF